MPTENELRYIAYRDSRPGYLFRRSHQIAYAAFTAATRRTKVTPAQFGVLAILTHVPEGMDQVSIARLLALDKATTGIVIGILVRRGLVAKRRGADRRRFHPTLTPRGRAMFRTMDRISLSLAATLLAPLSRTERATFMRLLVKLVRAHSDAS